MTGLKGTTGRTNVKPQTFKTAANAALSLGWWQMLEGKRCQPLAQLGPTVWGDLYLHSLYVVLGVKLQIDFLQKVDSIHTHHPTVQWALLNVFWICLAWADQPFGMWILISVRTGKDRSGYKTPCSGKPHVGGSRMHRASPEHPRRAAWRMMVSSQGPWGTGYWFCIVQIGW